MDGQKLVKQPNGRQYPAYIVTLMSNEYGGASDKPGHAMFLPGGTYHSKVLNSIKNAANPLARVEELYNKLVEHADREHNPLQDVQIQNNLDPAMKKFREDWPNARTQQEKDAVITEFTTTFSRNEAGLLRYMMLYGRENARTVLGNPKTFASAITDILFGEYDALTEGLDEGKSQERCLLRCDGRARPRLLGCPQGGQHPQRPGERRPEDGRRQGLQGGHRRVVGRRGVWRRTTVKA